MDLQSYTLEFNPPRDGWAKHMQHKAQLLAVLRRVIGFRSTSKLESSYTQILGRNLTKAQADQLRTLGSPYLYLRRTLKRYYPQADLAAHVLGYVDIFGEARQGIEARYEERLLDEPDDKFELSLDSRLQVLIEKALKEHVIKTKAEKAAVIVLKTKTAEVLSWAAYPDYNPNKYFKYSPINMKNWSLSDVYQPGSIFKVVTVSSALDSATIPYDYHFLDEGYLQVDKWKIKNHDYIKGKTEPVDLDLQALFARSSNPFSAHVALKMGAGVFFDYIKAYGFGSKTGIEMAGESRGLLKSKNKWRNSDVAATGIGHGAISVTPLQMVTAINVIANHGKWIRPTVLKRRGYEIPKEDIRQVVRPEIADYIANLLRKSVAYNLEFKHSIAGRVPGLSIAGKTGTAEKIEKGRYSHRRTVASFLGFFPAENPRYIAIAVVDDPKTDGGWGDTVAGPLFNKVAQFCKNLYL